MNLTALAQVVGMVLVRWLAPLEEGEERIALRDIKWRSVMKVICIDMAANVLLQSALILVGGGVFVVFYSSCTLWTAMISYCVSGKVLSGKEWAGILVLTIGLMFSAVFNHKDAGGEAHNVALGGAMMLVGTLCHSLAFVVDEAIIEGGMAAHTLCFASGTVDTSTRPHFCVMCTLFPSVR
jgi:drug/metabolite transporter (DMT)-like permease